MSTAYEDTLVVIPCGRMKIWKQQPRRGPTAARDAYTSDYFRLNRNYAEAFAGRWVILSDKYGFIDPDFMIPESYEVTFDNPASGPILPEELRRQVHERGLAEFKTVLVLGGHAHRQMTKNAFAGTVASVLFPVAGGDIEAQMRRTREAIVRGKPY